MNMKNNLGVKTFVLSTLFSIFACPICAGGNISNAKTAEMKVKSVKINGYVGGRIDDCDQPSRYERGCRCPCGAFPS